ncbi:DUF1571 domain-containing protein [Tautonia rosea]|uniref:DUF1571 domain-containing protein n=1 Tax=Tautonia rosea TaxID=2728037 RepID=UPI001F1998B0|nr:DUF1571 domain-containing protein [Tautonia rosea]
MLAGLILVSGRVVAGNALSGSSERNNAPSLSMESTDQKPASDSRMLNTGTTSVTTPFPDSEPVGESSTESLVEHSRVDSPENETDSIAISESEPLRLANANPVDRMPPGLNTRHSAIDPSSDPIDYAKAALAESKERFASVRDYTCTFIKRERIQGRLSGYEVMSMKARTSPKSVYFKFKQPKAGREAIYVDGRNRGKAIVHDVGFNKFLAGTLHLDPLSRRAMDGNRHPITEAGLGFMIDTLTEGWNREMNPRDSEVTIRETVLVNKRPSMMIICKHRNRQPHFVFHEVRLYIDHELGLPTRFEAYDWPAGEDQPAPLLEEYIYSDLKINVGLSDADFDPSNKAYSFGRF